jgi:predicted  nucleic acid-binding Zn-ribbon protein
MKKIFKPVVLAILAGSLAVVSCTQDNRAEIDGIKNDIAALKDKVAANEVDVKAQIGTLQYLLQSYKDEVNPKLVALDAQLKKDYADLSAADADLSKAIKDAQTVLQAAIAKNADDIAANKKEIQAAIAEYKKLVADAIEGFELAMAKAKEDQALVDGAQNMAIEALSAQFETFKEAVDEAISNLGESVDELAAAVEGMGDDIEDLQQQVDDNLAASYAYTDALAVTVDAALGVLEERIAANEAAIKKLNEETIPEIEEAILALQTSIVGLEGNVAALEEKKLDKSVFEAFLKEHTEWKATIDNSIKSINGSIELLKIYDGIIGSSVEQLTDLVNRLNGSEVVPGSVKQQIKDAIAAVYESITKDLEALKTDIEGKIETLQTDVKSLKGSLDLANAEIDIIHGNLDKVKKELTDINAKIAAAQGDIKDLQDAKTKLEDDLKALEAALESRMKAVEELTAGLKDQIDTINGDKETEGSIAYAVEQLRASIQTEIDELAGKVNKNAEDIAKLQEEIGKLQQRIQSLVFVPQYTDLKFGIPFTSIAGVYKAYNSPQGFPIVYKVSPVELAKPLADAVNEAIKEGVAPVFTFDIESGLQTRATATDPKLIIKNAIGDEATGKITLFLDHQNFKPKAIADKELDEYAISLRADNDDFKVHVASEFVQAKLHAISSITAVTDYLYKPNVTTGEVDYETKIHIDNTSEAVEGRLAIEYTDSKPYTYFDGYEMAYKDEKGVIRTSSQFKALGYDMPTVKTTVKHYATGTKNIVADLKANPVTFSVKIKDGDKDNMVNAKKDIVDTPIVYVADKVQAYRYTYSDGTTQIDAEILVALKRHEGAFQINLPFAMNWTYDLDAKVDHDNIGGWASAYERAGSATPELDKFVVTPTLTVGNENLVLDGSNKVYGLTASDFAAKTFAASAETPLPTNVSFNVVNAIDGTDAHTLSLTKFEVAGERLGKSYVYTGTYNQNSYSTKGVTAKVSITSKDRKTEDIKITAPAKLVKLLKTPEFNSTDDYYTIKSDDFSDALMTAYVNQNIFADASAAQKTAAFADAGEFGQATAKWSTSGLDTKFNFERDITTPEAPTFKMTSKDNLLKSAVLHQVATGSDCEAKPWTLTVQTYVGQNIIITWPIGVTPLYDYRFVTYGLNTSDNSFLVPIKWNTATDHITKAQTELDLINYNLNNVKVMYKEGTSEYVYKPSTEYGQATFMIVPRFSLVGTPTDIKVANTGTSELPCLSNVEYYGQAASVGVTSALYIKSGDTEFYVPGSDKMYVGETPITSVTVKQSNPIAATQVDPTATTVVTAPTVPALVQLTMKDVLGNSIYADGYAQNGGTTPMPPYYANILDIFGHVYFSVYSVNESTSTTGWSINGANAFGISDTPTQVQLVTLGVASGPYTVVIKAKTAWKDYFYTVKVNVQ